MVLRRASFAAACLLFLFRADAQVLPKIADDEDSYYTNVGNLALTITNFGTVGTRNRYWPNQPSCEYPKGSRIEHMYQGGLWVGGKPRNRTGIVAAVSTGVTDRSGSSGEGYEYTTAPGERMLLRSSLSDSRYFDVSAISHQDLVADYSDRRTRVPASGDSIWNHQPLGIDIRQEAFAWNYPFAEYFIILSYTIVNASPDTLDDVYLGFWANNVVRNTNFVRPGTTGYFDYGGNGYDSLRRMMYTFEFQPSPGSIPADSYVGIALLGTTPFPEAVDSLAQLYQRTFFNAWRFRSSSGTQAYFSPTDDYNSDRYLSRYTRMTQSLPQGNIDALRLAAGNYTTMLSTGPFHTLAPAETLQVVFAVVCAKKDGSDLERLDQVEQRRTLNAHLQWAQQTYSGEDINGNNRLDLGEDIVSRGPGGLLYGGDGLLTRYVLPTPPARPRVRVEVANENIAVYWDRVSAEESRDPISGLLDFEGYRIYRSKPGADFLSNENFLLSVALAGEFDRADNSIGYNTGFDAIRLAQPRTFPGDTLADGSLAEYWYRFPPANANVTHLNGWQYLYGVSAFDRGDLANNLTSLESAQSIVRAVAGTPATSDPNREVFVYPNPYYAKAYWDGTGERARKIYFANLPARAVITIYTIAGDVVAELHHDADNAGNDIEWFNRFGDRTQQPTFSGGEHAWDLITKNDQALASGLYLFAVKNLDGGDVKTGKFVVIK